MSKKFQLQIPKPCHENWDKMTPDQKGRFCSSCQKQVIDFSRMSDREVAMFFKKPTTGSVCGRFMTDQLNRDLEIPRKRIPWVKYFFQFLLPGFLISMKSSAQENSKSVKKIQTTGSYSSPVQKPIPIENSVILGELSLHDSTTLANFNTIKNSPGITREKIVIIKGKVLNEYHEAIPYATVAVTNMKIAANSSGNYQVKISTRENNLVIAASSAGYFSKEITREATRDVIYQDIVLKADDILPEVVLISYETMGKVDMAALSKKQKKIEQFSCSMTMGGVMLGVTIEQKIENDAVKKILPPEMKLYPNPIRSNSTLHIAWQQNETGDYDLQFFNVSGQLVFKKELYIDEDARVLSIDLPSLLPGNYFIKMINRSTSKSYTAKIIVQ